MANPRLAPTPPRERVRHADRQVNFRITRVGVQRVIEEANRRDG